MDKTEYDRKRRETMRRIKRLRLMDDDFMTKCFEDSPRCVELLLRIIMDMPDLQVIRVRTQYVIKNLQGRSVRLDIFAVDSSGRRYNIEIQRDAPGAGAKRARYNCSVIDANILPAGDDTESLPEIYVIFITEHDVLGCGEAVYHVRRVVEETGRPFGDGSNILYVNGAYRGDTPIGRLMSDFSCTDPDEMNYPLLADRVRYFKENEEGIGQMSKIWDEVREEGLKEGRKEGRKEGLQEGSKIKLMENIKALMKNLNFTAEQAMDALGVSAEEKAAFAGQIAVC